MQTYENIWFFGIVLLVDVFPNDLSLFYVRSTYKEFHIDERIVLVESSNPFLAIRSDLFFYFCTESKCTQFYY